MGERPYHLLGNHHGARQLHSRPSHFLREFPANEVDGRDAAVLACEKILHLGESRDVTREHHAKGHVRVTAARSRVLWRLASLINGQLASWLRLSSTLPFPDRGDFASRDYSAVVLINFVCGHLAHEYSVPINYYTSESPKIWEVLAPFIGREISLCDFVSVIKKYVFWRRVGDRAMKNLKQFWTINWLF